MARLQLCYVCVCVCVCVFVGEYTYVLQIWINRYLIKNKATTVTSVTVIKCIQGLTSLLCKREKA